MERYILANLERVFGGVKPMNNIEILEERINFCKNNTECREELKQCFGCAFEIEEIQAIENLIQENKELKDTLKQTQDSWYEDTKKIELNKECEIALNNRILDLEQENKELKEKLQQYKKIEEIVNTITDDDIRNAIKNAEKDYIPKSKVKEKIEYHKKIDNLVAIMILEKLLEEGE